MANQYGGSHVANYREGETGYYENAEPAHGTVTVDADSRRYVYRIDECDEHDFLAWVERTWNGGFLDRELVVTGDYPRYSVE